MGKAYMADAIQFEAQELVKEIKSFGEVPMIPPKGLRTAVLNVVWQMIAGKRYDLRSTEVDRIFNVGEEFIKESHMMFFDTFFPVLRIIPKSIRDRVFGTKVVTRFRNEMHSIISVSVATPITIMLFTTINRISQYLQSFKHGTFFNIKLIIFQIITEIA